MEPLDLKNKTVKILKSRGAKIGIIVLTPLLVMVLVVLSWAHQYATGVLAGFSTSDALVAAFDRNTLVYGQNGDLITELHAEINRIPVALKESLSMFKSLVAMDQRYYSHRGGPQAP